MFIGFMVIGACMGSAVSLGVLTWIHNKDLNELGDDSIRMLRDEYSRHAKEVESLYSEIERMQDTINNLQIERAKAMAKVEGYADLNDAIECSKISDFNPEWLEFFNDVSTAAPDGPEFGGF